MEDTVINIMIHLEIGSQYIVGDWLNLILSRGAFFCVSSVSAT